MNQPIISSHNHADIVEKYDNVCHVVHKIASLIKQLKRSKKENKEKSQRDSNSLTMA
jgi:hypothetical protein